MDQPSKADAFHAIVGKALIDQEFRAKLMDPNQRGDAVNSMLADTGVSSDEIHQEVDDVIDAIDNLAGKFDIPIKAAS